MKRVKQECLLKCKLCDADVYMLIDMQSYKRWIAGDGYIQDLMPELTAGERELLISGICDTCFNEMFKEVDDE